MHKAYSNGDPREIIERLRIAKGFTSARALALAAGINQPTLARYLNGTSDTMEVASFQALAEVLEVTLSELLGEVPISNSGRVREMLQLMQKLPEPEIDALIAAGEAFAQSARKRR